MLVLTRKEGDSFLIGDNIEVMVQSIKGDKVRIAISAPKDIMILRKELVEACELNRSALLPEVSAINALKDSMKK
jgi:carbon storage regulator